MNRFTSIAASAAALLASLGTLLPVPAAAQPRGRSQAAQSAQAEPPAAEPSEDEGDGPEARGVALFKLEDVIEVAVRLSPDVARARTDREIARDTAEAAGAGQQWVLSAGVNYQRDALGADAVDANQRLVPLTPLSTDVITGTLGLGRNLPTGGNLKLDLSLSHKRQEVYLTGEAIAMNMQSQSECGENIDIFCQDQALAKLTLKQPLARGLGSDVALADQRRADLSAAKATVTAQIAAELLIRDLVVAYWDLAYAAYEVDTRAASLEDARKQEQITRQQVRAGTVPSNSSDAVTYDIATRDEALLVAKIEFEKKSLELRRKAGLEIGRRDILVRPAEPLELDNQEWNIDEVLAQSHKINRQLASIVLDKRLADVDVDVTHNAMLPRLDLTLSGGVTGTGDTSSAAFSGLGGDSSNGFGYQVMADLTVSFDLSGSAKAANAAAVGTRHKLDIERVDKERQIDAQIVSAVKQLMSARTRVALNDKAVAVGEENVRTERANFLAQRSTNFNVMQRQGQLYDARLRRGQAVAEYRKAVVQLQYLSGQLLDAYRIRVRQTDDRPAPRTAKAARR
jgi:outer membrane protein TolC